MRPCAIPAGLVLDQHILHLIFDHYDDPACSFDDFSRLTKGLQIVDLNELISDFLSRDSLSSEGYDGVSIEGDVAAVLDVFLTESDVLDLFEEHGRQYNLSLAEFYETIRHCEPVSFVNFLKAVVQTPINFYSRRDWRVKIKSATLLKTRENLTCPHNGNATFREGQQRLELCNRVDQYADMTQALLAARVDQIDPAFFLASVHRLATTMRIEEEDALRCVLRASERLPAHMQGTIAAKARSIESKPPRPKRSLPCNATVDLNQSLDNRRSGHWAQHIFPTRVCSGRRKSSDPSNMSVSRRSLSRDRESDESSKSSNRNSTRAVYRVRCASAESWDSRSKNSKVAEDTGQIWSDKQSATPGSKSSDAHIIRRSSRTSTYTKAPPPLKSISRAVGAPIKDDADLKPGPRLVDEFRTVSSNGEHEKMDRQDVESTSFLDVMSVTLQPERVPSSACPVDHKEIGEGVDPSEGLKSSTREKKRISTPRRSATSSEHFAKSPAPDPKNTKRLPAGTSCIPVPPLSHPTFGLIQEELASKPFQLLLAVLFLNKTRGDVAIPIFWSILAQYPTSSDLANAKFDDVLALIKHLGLQNQRARKVIALAQLWESDPPTRGRRFRTLNYPYKGAHKDIAPHEVLSDDDEREAAIEIAHLPGCGAYAFDSWRIFCRDELRGLAGGWDGEDTDDAFEPEWKRVVPMDKELRAFLRWQWLKEGWDWDPLTGEKEVARQSFVDAVEAGNYVWVNRTDNLTAA